MAVIILEKSQNPEFRGRIYPLCPLGEPIVIGRDQSSDLPIGDARASRQHARLTLRHGSWLLEDLDSRNGTIHRGERIEKARLKPDDAFQIGSTLLHLVQDRSLAPGEGHELHGCQILEHLGDQGAVQIFSGKQLAMDRRVRVDAIHPAWPLFEPGSPTEAHLALNLDELLVAARDLDHEGILEFTSHQLPDSRGCGMVLHRGGEEKLLSSRLETLLRVPLRNRLLWLLQLARALEARSQREALRLPLSLAGIGITPDGRPVLPALDLGAWILLRTGAVIHDPATLPYLAPELIPDLVQGLPAPTELARESLAYGLGALAYQVLGGTPPTGEGRGESIIRHHLKQRPEPLEASCPQAPGEVTQMVDALLEKKPADRPDLEEVVAVLESTAAVRTQDTGPAPARPAASTAGPGRREPVSSAAAPASSTPWWLYLPLWAVIWALLFIGARLGTAYLLGELARSGS